MERLNQILIWCRLVKLEHRYVQGKKIKCTNLVVGFSKTNKNDEA